MKIKIYFIVLVLALMLSSFTFGQNNNGANSNSQEQLTSEQVQQAKKLLEQLVEPKQQTTTANKPSSENGKTMADVLDKGIDMFAGYVTSVSDMIQKIAPDVWRIMIKQQYAKAISGPVIPIFLLIMILLYHSLAKKWFKITPEDKLFDFSNDDLCGRSWFLSVIPLIASGGIGIWLAIAINNSIQIAINPEYYALKDLLSMILGKQTM